MVPSVLDSEIFWVSNFHKRFWITLLYTARVTTTGKRPVIRTSYEDVDPLLCSKSHKVVTNVLNEVVRQAPSSQWYPRFWTQNFFGFFNFHKRFWLTLLYTARVTTTGKRPLIRTSYEDVDPLLCSKSHKVVTNVLSEMLRQAPSS